MEPPACPKENVADVGPGHFPKPCSKKKPGLQVGGLILELQQVINSYESDISVHSQATWLTISSPWHRARSATARGVA